MLTSVTFMVLEMRVLTGSSAYQARTLVKRLGQKGVLNKEYCIKSLIINIKAVSGTEQPQRKLCFRFKLLYRRAVILHFPPFRSHSEKKVHDH